MKNWKMVELTDVQMLQILMAFNHVQEDYKARFHDWDEWASKTKKEINERYDDLLEERYPPRTFEEICSES